MVSELSTSFAYTETISFRSISIPDVRRIWCAYPRFGEHPELPVP